VEEIAISTEEIDLFSSNKENNLDIMKILKDKRKEVVYLYRNSFLFFLLILSIFYPLITLINPIVNLAMCFVWL
jgi:hypothetical protein